MFLFFTGKSTDVCVLLYEDEDEDEKKVDEEEEKEEKKRCSLFALSRCCFTSCWFPHVILGVSDLLMELQRQRGSPLQTLGLQVPTAAVDADQIHWTQTESVRERERSLSMDLQQEQ